MAGAFLSLVAPAATAHTSLLATAATASRLLRGPGAFGLGTTFQAVPFQCSISVVVGESRWRVRCFAPTAQTSVAPTAATPSNLAGAGSSTDGTADQRLPSQCSVNGTARCGSNRLALADNPRIIDSANRQAMTERMCTRRRRCDHRPARDTGTAHLTDCERRVGRHNRRDGRSNHNSRYKTADAHHSCPPGSACGAAASQRSPRIQPHTRP